MKSPLLFSPDEHVRSGAVINDIHAQQAGWHYLNMEIRQLQAGERWHHHTGQYESVVVILGGSCTLTTRENTWKRLGQRTSVFDGMPTAFYISRNQEFTVDALTNSLELAHCWVPVSSDHPTQVIQPEDCSVEIRGGHNATRQINSIVPPGFDCERIVCVEVFTPGGNWSSYPGHKHDRHMEADNGELLEADLEEIYYYQIKNTLNQRNGFAIQRVYNQDRSLDETIVVHDHDIVLIPEGYHPVCAAEGYDCYYLNFLAGSAQSLACTDDPDYAWIKDSWTWKDPRVPLVKLKEQVPV
jgi:5-deoxy-glucuronate isomerase